MQTKQQLNLNPLIVGLVACALTLALLALAMPVLVTSAQTITAASPDAAPAVITSTVAAPKVLRIGEDIFPDMLDPQKASFVNELALLALTYEGLTTIDANGQWHPAAADRATVSTDGMTVTVHLREGLKRADGSAITAKDFEYALKRAVDPRIPGKQYVSLLFDLQGARTLAEMDPEKATDADIEKAFAEYGVKAVDDSNLVLTFTRPVASYWAYIASMPVFYPTDAKAVSQDPENWWKNPANHNGNGPFMFKEIDATNSKVTLVPNPNYRQGQAKLDRIEFSYNPDNMAVLQAFEDGKLDIDASVAPELVPTVISNTKVVSDFLHYPAAQTVAMAFNNTRKPFDDRNVRIAFSQALDRFGFIRDQLDGVGAPYTRWIPPDVPGNQASEPGVPDSDAAAAVNTLVNNGYAAKDSTADKPKVDCAKLGEIKFTYPDSPINQKRAEYLTNNLSQVIGCPITPEPISGTEFTSLTKDVRTNPQLSLQRWVQDYPHPQNWLSVYWTCGAFSRRYGYCNLFLDEILKQADATADLEKAIPLYQQAEDMLIQDVPGAFMYNPENLQLVKPYVLGPTDNLSSQDAGWAGQFGPVWQYDIDLSQVPASYPTQ
ncbi:MAG: Dipeptide-binding protein DppE [Anaerolineae bacterium]|nr:Dipeptide-binding protein DppE [Anaerolineae bacterium]